MPPFKDEHILLIAPGSQTTLAQLGLPESYTPATTRLRTRMFPAPEKDKWEPTKIRQIKKPTSSVAEGEATEGTDAVKDEEPEFVEDLESDEGAVYPLTEGRISNMAAFLALLNHIHNTMSPTLHTPILLIAQPAWTAQDHETITQFFFEKFKTPAFCILDSALAIAYGYGVSSGLVIDVGYEKADISVVYDYAVQSFGRSISLTNAGGDAMTRRLLELLEPKGWTRDMCEQLKKNNSLCEVLPAGTELPVATANTAKEVSNPAAAASTGATSSGPSAKVSDIPRGPGPSTEVGEEEDGEDGGRLDDDGVLDVASIVASGKTAEYLAAQEKKKAAAAQRKATREANIAAEQLAAKPVRLPNSKREKAIFHYQERRTLEEAEEAVQKLNTASADAQAVALIPVAGEDAPAEAAPATDTSLAVEEQNANKEQARAAKREEKRKARDGQGDQTLVRKEIEIGTERFLAASGGVLETIADAVHRTVIAVPEIGRRSEIWDGVIITGNGSKIRGFKEALLNTLSSRYLISPSSATMFTSELPSNLSTPMGTGSQTPVREMPPGQFPLPSGPSGVNPLLLAATTASNPSLQNNSILGPSTSGSHSSHSQSPTSIKVAKIPEYFPEFKTHGYDEVVFLGAQVAAKVIFVVDQGISGGFLSRVQYNENGPQGIHEVGMV